MNTKDTGRKDPAGMPRPRGLGRGLAALLGDAPAATPADAAGARDVGRLPIEYLQPGRFQPRTQFPAEQLEELAQSLRANGMVQPILVRPLPERDRYEIIAGERRWRAAQLAQLHEVPVVVRTLDDRSALEIALVENLQRQDLNPLEEAAALQQLKDQFGLTQEEIAQRVGKSRSHVANTLRLLEFPPFLRSRVLDGSLTAGHARALAGCPDAEALAERVAAEGMSVRQAETLARQARQRAEQAAAAAIGDGAAAAPAPRPEPAGSIETPGYQPSSSPDVTALARSVEGRLGLRTELRVGGGEKTVLLLHCETYEQLDDIVARLNSTPRR